jgi:hypothetical protein
LGNTPNNLNAVDGASDNENFFERIKKFRRVATRCVLDKYVSQRG